MLTKFRILLMISVFFQIDAGENSFDTNYLDEDFPFLNISPECEQMGICEDVPNFPEKIISHLIDKLQNKNAHFNQDPIDFYKDISDTGAEDEPLCSYIKKSIFPKVAKDVNGRWQYILNTDKMKVQRFNVELCANGTLPLEGGSCLPIAYFKPNEYEGVCTQKFTARKVFAFDSTFNKTMETFINVPSCCSCVARPIYKSNF